MSKQRSAQPDPANSQLHHRLDELGDEAAASVWRASPGPSLDQVRTRAEERQRTRGRRRRVATSASLAVVFAAGLTIGAQLVTTDAATTVAVTASTAEEAAGSERSESTASSAGAEDDAATCAVNVVTEPRFNNVRVSLTPADQPPPTSDGWSPPPGWVSTEPDSGSIAVALPADHALHGLHLTAVGESVLGAAACDGQVATVSHSGETVAQFTWHAGRILNHTPVLSAEHLAGTLAPADIAACPARTGHSHTHPNWIRFGPTAPSASARDAFRALLASGEPVALPPTGWHEFVVDADTLVYVRSTNGQVPTLSSDDTASPAPFDYRIMPQRSVGYVAQAGDTLDGLATQIGLSTDALLAVNPGIEDVPLVSGQRVKLAVPFDQLDPSVSAIADHYDALVHVQQSDSGWHVTTWMGQDC